MPTSYPVNEVFYTIQGEAEFTGTPAVFIRLQGCRVGCPWCDTKHTWEIEKKNQTRQYDVIEKREDSRKFAVWTAESLVALVHEKWPTARHIVITGGEPTQHDLVELVAFFERDQFRVQIETSGTYKLPEVGPNTWITVSPKLGPKMKRPLLLEVLNRADEVKYPVGKENDLIILDSIKASVPSSVPIWLQPLSKNKNATALCVNACKRYGYRLSLQTHKYAGIA